MVTGGAGFIGSNFILAERIRMGAKIINLDLLTYAGNPMNLESLREDPDYIFVKGDIKDRALVGRILGQFKPMKVVNFFPLGSDQANQLKIYNKAMKNRVILGLRRAFLTPKIGV